MNGEQEPLNPVGRGSCRDPDRVPTSQRARLSKLKTRAQQTNRLIQNGILRVPVHLNTGFLEARIEESQWEFKTREEYGITRYLLIRTAPDRKFPITYNLAKEHWDQLQPILNPDICP